MKCWLPITYVCVVYTCIWVCWRENNLSFRPRGKEFVSGHLAACILSLIILPDQATDEEQQERGRTIAAPAGAEVLTTITLPPTTSHHQNEPCVFAQRSVHCIAQSPRIFHGHGKGRAVTAAVPGFLWRRCGESRQRGRSGLENTV